MDSSQKGPHLGSLQLAWSNCQGCMLSQTRKNIVFGYGNPDAQVMVIAEAPGKTEDEQGYPLIGQSGQFLDIILAETSADPDIIALSCEITESNTAAARLRKQERRDGALTGVEEMRRQMRGLLLNYFYFTNVVMCRPPENRDPTPKEVEACRKRLLEQIYTIDPVLIIAVGRVSLEVLLNKKISIGSARGTTFEVEIPGRILPYRVGVLPVFHPSYLLRKNDFSQRDGDSRKTFEDFLAGMKILDQFNFDHYGLPKPKTRPKE